MPHAPGEAAVVSVVGVAVVVALLEVETVDRGCPLPGTDGGGMDIPGTPMLYRKSNHLSYYVSSSYFIWLRSPYMRLHHHFIDVCFFFNWLQEVTYCKPIRIGHVAILIALPPPTIP